MATATTASTGITLDLRGARHQAAGVTTWATKTAALASLAALRECGLNRGRDIEAHQARTHLFWVWVISRPDHYNGITYLMTGDGLWVPGRLYDAAPCWCEPTCRSTSVRHTAPWTPLSGEPEPATVTHDYQYSAGSRSVLGGDGKPLMSDGLLGSAPVEVLHWSASAWCVACTWSTHDSHEGVVRASARYHRKHPEQYPHHTTPRRTPASAR